jgi:hypothetical protein
VRLLLYLAFCLHATISSLCEVSEPLTSNHNATYSFGFHMTLRTKNRIIRRRQAREKPSHMHRLTLTLHNLNIGTFLIQLDHFFSLHLYPDWGEAVLTSVYLLNRMPTPVLNWDSPFSRLFGRIPCYSDLRVFGCACYPHLGAYVTNKPRTTECVFLGYSSQHKGYRCLDPVTGRVYVSRHVRFDETTYPYASRHYASSSPADSDIAIVPVLPPAATCPHSTRPCSRQTSFTLPTASG